MKSKSKKTDKKKPVSNKKNEAAAPLETVSEQLECATPSKNEPALTSESELIEVLPEQPKPKTSVVEERRVISSEERQRLISLAAYYRAQRTGFGKTNPVEDWLLAEREVDAMIAGGNAI